eukprot:scaffold23369_cov109-Skeletonema_dohrnii-CCMP3373.AAC.1
MIRCKRSRCTSRRLLVLLLLSYPALVAAPYTSSSIGASSLSTSTSAAAASVVTGAICYAHRTRKWTRDESRLEEKCRQYGVMYTPPESNENEQDQNKRRSRLAEECRMEQSKRRRIKNADAQKKKRSLETPTETAMRQSKDAEAKKKKRSLETPTETAIMRQSKDAEAKKQKHGSETPAEKKRRNEQNAQHMKEKRDEEDLAYEIDDDIMIDGVVPYIDISLEGVKKARSLLTRTDPILEDNEDDGAPSNTPKNQRHRAI